MAIHLELKLFKESNLWFCEGDEVEIQIGFYSIGIPRLAVDIERFNDHLIRTLSFISVFEFKWPPR